MGTLLLPRIQEFRFKDELLKCKLNCNVTRLYVTKSKRWNFIQYATITPSQGERDLSFFKSHSIEGEFLPVILSP